jgi:phosphotriesterase-related protein
MRSIHAESSMSESRFKREIRVSLDVMTVLGPVPAGELGITLPHEHLINNAAPTDPDAVLDDPALIAAEIERFKTTGGRTIVEVSSGGLGRDPQGLAALAVQTGLTIVMGCGWYHEGQYPPELFAQSIEKIAGGIAAEIECGVADSGIRPGIIGEVGCDGSVVTPAEEKVLRAAGRVQASSGLALTTHAVFSPIGLDQLDLFEAEGADLSRVIIGHCDSYPHFEYHEEIARRGAYVEFDFVRGVAEWPAELHLKLVLHLLDRGYRDRILLSHDICKPHHLAANGGFGYDHLLSTFVPALKEAGAGDDDIRAILIDNPRRVLTGADAV